MNALTLAWNEMEQTWIVSSFSSSSKDKYNKRKFQYYDIWSKNNDLQRLCLEEV